MAKSASVIKENRRLTFLGAGILVIAGLLIFNLFDRSILSHKTVLAEARNQQLTKKNVEPKRGPIYAVTNDGNFPLATTDEKFTVSVIPKNIKDKTKAAQVLASALAQDEKEIFDKINNDKLYIPPLAQRVERDVAQKIVEPGIVGIVIKPNYVRFYPEGQLAANILGFVDFENKGKYGLEGYYNEELRGFGGTVVAEKDNKGRLISLIGKQAQAQDGDTIVLTIDQNVQYIAEQKLHDAIGKYGATSGQIAIIDIKTGAITAMASLPSFDPNKFNEVKPEDQSVFSNPTIGSVYEPGSIIKPLVVAMGLDTGVLTPDMEGNYTDHVTVQGYEIHTATKKAFGHETVTQVLENSDNVAMVSFGDKIGTDAMYDYFQKFGFGTKFGIDSNGETTGKLLEKKKWRDINRATISFGQGISVTPLQILMGYQAIANDGKLVQPHLVSKIIKPDGSERVIQTKELRQVVKPETAAAVRNMLVSVVVRGHGKKAAIPGYKIGGKTGTAQIPNKDKSGYEENSHIGSFAGVVPADNPRFAMLVKLDRPTAVEFAESSAAPTFGEVAKFLLQYYQIPKSE